MLPDPDLENCSRRAGFWNASSMLIGCDSGGNNSEDSQLAVLCNSDRAADLCNHKYALCIAASCDPDTMSGSKIECGHCDTDDGSCGYCYVFEGLSCSYSAPCSEVEPSGDVVYSTYSEELSLNYGFGVMECGETQPLHANCMDAKCTLTGDSVSLEDDFGITVMVRTAICECTVSSTEKPLGTLGGQCSEQNCSAIWSTALDHGDGVLDVVPQCLASE